MKGNDPAYRTFERMNKRVIERGLTHTDLDESVVGDAERVLYVDIKSYQFQDPEGPQFSFVTLFLSSPGSSCRHYNPRCSIEVRSRSTGHVKKIFYGHFGRDGKPLNEDAKKLRETLFGAFGDRPYI